ncbi:MAG: DNA polymerase-3 subunit delta [Oceanicoccus sp.]|jgi:DNA polymerase-3 subunit delta
MRLRPDQLAQNLKKGLLSIYIVSGDEPLLIQECSDEIRLHCRKQGFSREVLHVDTSFDWNELHNCSNAMSLFAERKLIELRMPSGKPGKVGSEAISEYINNASPDNVLLVISNKIESAATRSKWYKNIESAGAGIQVWPISARELPQWIGRRLNQAGLKASPEAIALLSERIEGNLLAAVQEIEKLKLLAPSDIIDVDTITNAVANSARYDIFGLTDRALEGDAQGSVRMLQGLRAEGTELPIILWALSKELRILLQCRAQLDQGNDIERALQNMRVWDKRKPLIKKAISRLNKNNLRQLLSLATDVDRSIKGIKKGNSWDLLEQIVLMLAGTQVFAAI